ncbi:hypothetical protein [Natrinema pallidum]|uniref:Uncharacterized protein n=1 Tax=Natrinema pallidum TaxID=69527 RepID=A0A4P9TM10_9EURY|nr:hypothetical protein [Natrinema pallidum]QCW05242.1 hypothetical protein FGF80_18510 [Natrinema pallidum]
MTTNRLRTTLAALLLVASLLVGGVATATAQQNTTADTTTADLAVGQPHYIGDDVRERTENGSKVYIAKGERLTLTPENFETDNVTDYQVATDGGQLTYDSTLETYVFEPGGGEGTYDLEWTVREYESVTVTEGNNTTTERQRADRTYTAKLRVDGGLNMTHLSAADNERRQHHLELGREVNATTDELRDRSLPMANNDGSDYEIFQSMTNRYIDTGHPFNLLTGNIGMIVTTIVVTMGGWLLIVLTFGSFGAAIRALKKKLHIHESIEHEEGEIADRHAELEIEERNRKLQNVDHNDVYADDAIAGWMREAGENVHDALHTLTSGELQPKHWMADRLAVMGAAGYQADVTRTASDGDGDGEATITDATLATPDADSDTLEPIAELDLEKLVEAIDWDDSVLWNDFRLPDADVDFSELDREPLTMNLDATMHEANLQVERFPNKRVAGQCVLELIESVEAHEYTDADGKPQLVRELLNNWLKTLQHATDRHRMPVQAISEALEQALENHDPNAEARQAAQEVRAGAD